MDHPPPVLDYARPSVRSMRPLLPWQTIAAIAPLLIAPGTACMCGHLGPVSLPLSTSAAALAWWGAYRGSRSWGGRLLVVAIVVLGSLVFLKNIADILWFGHDPLLR